jgi:hypothetical protein
MTGNQIVAHNLRRARLAKDWTLEETTRNLKPHGLDWSVAVLSNAEGSRHGKRVRKFDADAILAFAQCFGEPVGYFFEPVLAERLGTALLSTREDAYRWHLTPAVSALRRTSPPCSSRRRNFSNG